MLPPTKSSHSSRRAAAKRFLEICLDSSIRLTKAECYESALLYEIDTDVCSQKLYARFFPPSSSKKKLSKPSHSDRETYFSETELKRIIDKL